MKPTGDAASLRNASIETLDLELYRPGFASAHLIRWPGGCALVDVGSSCNLSALKSALAARGLRVSDVTLVFVTHVHLDHAGGAGALLAEPGCRATLVVHENGARHMADPSALEQGARAVYGDEEFERTYGSLVPIAKDRMKVVKGGEEIRLSASDRSFDARIIDTPGHARHHYCLFLPALDAVFTGDTYGISYPVMKADWPEEVVREPLGPAQKPLGPVYLYPTTTPTAFDPVALKASVRGIADLRPAVCYLTHFGALVDPASHAEQLCARIDTMVEAALKVAKSAQDKQAAVGDLARSLESGARSNLVACGFSEEKVQAICTALQFDFLLNSQGLLHWLFHHGPLRERV